jgi:superfamily II DNA/RNA helicase
MDTTTSHFSDLGISHDLLNVLTQAGFEHPTPIQKGAIPVALKGSDLVGCAQTGTGKTLAFVIPLLEQLKGKTGTHAAILCPTREIAMQTYQVIQDLGKKFHVTAVILIGGRKISVQIAELRKHPSILVVTPGRLVDHMERRNVNLKTIHHVVLDEADHMLDLGFLPQVRRIMSALPEKRQTMMFSATFPRAIEQLAQQYLREPQRINVAPPGTAASGLNHAIYLVEPQDKRRAIMELLKDVKDESTLVFTRTKLDAEWLYRLLQSQGHNVHALHSDRSQGQRIATLQSFKKGEFPILVATDVLARGIDISDITHVINFDIPQNPEDYVHRVGRTARAHKTGDASTLATWMEMSFVQAIEKQLGQKLPRKELPGIPAYQDVFKPKTPPGKIGRRGKRVRLR